MSNAAGKRAIGLPRLSLPKLKREEAPFPGAIAATTAF